MQKRRIRTGLFFLMMVLLFVLTGCSSNSSDSQGKAKILMSVSDASDTFRASLAKAAKEAADEKGITLEVMDAKSSVDTQVAQMKQAKEEGYDGIICLPVNADTAQQLQASAGDLPIVFCNSCPDEQNLEKDKYMFVGSDEAVAGTFQADYVLDFFKNKSELNVIIFKGESTHSATAGRTKAVKEALNASGKKINYVFVDNADWSDSLTKEMMEVFFKTGQPYDCVTSNNDSMALGAIEALKEHGDDLSEIPVLGVDATTDGCASIKAGEMAFTVYQSATGQGKAAIEVISKLVNGQSAQKVDGVSKDGLYVWVPFEKVDKSNVSNYN